MSLLDDDANAGCLIF